jgi:hypothetical protein
MAVDFLAGTTYRRQARMSTIAVPGYQNNVLPSTITERSLQDTIFKCTATSRSGNLIPELPVIPLPCPISRGALFWKNPRQCAAGINAATNDSNLQLHRSNASNAKRNAKHELKSLERGRRNGKPIRRER